MFKFLQRLAIFAVTFFILSESSALAQLPTPNLLCLSVKGNGNLEVSWEVGSGPFDGVRAYFKDSDAPLTEQPVPFDFPSTSSPGVITTINDANDKQYEVYLVTYSAGIESPHSQMLTTIKLDVTGNVLDGIVTIKWGSMSNTTYNIYRRSINDPNFIQLEQPSTNSYRDVIQEICNGDIFYYVEFTNDNCTFRSMTGSISGISDQTEPNAPKFEYITINEDGDAVLHWSLNNPPDDLKGFIIEIKENIGDTEYNREYAIVGEVYSLIANSLVYPDYYLNPCDTIVNFIIKAVDKCNNISEGSFAYDPTYIHNTIWLRVDMDVNCQRKAKLTWNNYNNMNPPVKLYKIWRSENGAPAIFIDGIAVDANGDAEEFTYTDFKILEPNVTYTYYISATGSAPDKSSESCRVQVTPEPKMLDIFELNNVTVVDNDYVELEGNANPLENLHEVVVYRSSTSAADLSQLPNNPWDHQTMTIIEASAEVNETAYYYQLFALDHCGYIMESSVVFRSIHLELEDIDDGNIHLNWNAFEGWDVGGYEIFRETDGILDADYPKTGTTGFADFIDPAATNGIITYYVEAIKENDNNVTSRSNKVELFREAEVLMPNAFRPESTNPLNNVFPPFDLIRNVEPSSYLLVIYNRWGQMVYETNDPATGWDGKKDGQMSPGGIYAYVITYADYNGNTFRQRGTVTLIR